MSLRGAAVLVGFALSGASALVLEVLWSRKLALLMGSTVEAFSAMLAAVMGGLALGGWLGGKVADRGGNLARVFVLLQVLIGALAVGSVAVMGGLLYLFRALHGALPHGVFMGLQFALGAGLLLAPTVLMGMTFPVLSRHITGSLQESGFRVGAAFSANTLGTVAGALAGGFLLVPLLGLMGSAWVAGGLNLAAAALVLATSR